MIPTPMNNIAYRRSRIALGCGVPPEDFQRQFDQLSEQNQEVLGKVAWRMMMATTIRHQVRNRVPLLYADSDASVRFNHSEMPSLELFYLFGCLDTLAGSDHTPFPEWLKKEDKANRLDLDGVMDVSKLIHIFETYQEAHGVSSRLRYAFGHLPDATVEWLCANVEIHRYNPGSNDHYPTESNSQKEEDVQKILKHWHAFFYELHRNPFAHQSTTKDIFITDDMKWAYSKDPAFGQELRSGTMRYKVGGKWWALVWRVGVDEALVLRVLIQGVALALLGLPVTPELVAGFVRRQLLVRALIGYLDEIERNADMIEDWTREFEPDDTSNRRLHAQEHGFLYTSWTISVLDLLDTAIIREKDLRVITTRYLERVQAINERESTFSDEISLIGDDPQREAAAIKFWKDLKDSDDFTLVREMPYQAEVIDGVNNIIANPCHIYN